MKRVLMLGYLVLANYLACGLALSSRGGGGGSAEGSISVEQGVVYVFGDSYADTGNHDPNSPNISISKPWKYPYGFSWPGQPSGRYSDGHLFTDLYVSQIDAKQPIPFRNLNISKQEEWQGRHGASSQGINFAFGGSGVFTTLDALVMNVSVQLEVLQMTIDSGIVNVDDLPSAIALFVISGNDYIAYVQEHPDLEGIEDFIPLVVNQMTEDLKILSKIGFKSIVVTNLSPLGCSPYMTYLNNYSVCIDTFNGLCAYHNSLLEVQISNLQENLTNTNFVIIDLFSAFNEVIQEASLSMRPCCEGSCAEVDENDAALYTLCSDSTATLYWDIVHPTNQGWKSAFSILFPSFQDV